jgi:hypothetical protein
VKLKKNSRPVLRDSNAPTKKPPPLSAHIVVKKTPERNSERILFCLQRRWSEQVADNLSRSIFFTNLFTCGFLQVVCSEPRVPRLNALRYASKKFVLV